MAPEQDTLHTAVPLWRNVRVYRIGAQIAFALVILLIGYWLYQNMLLGLERMNARLNFDFLQGPSSFALSETVIPYDPSVNSYAYAFLVGVLNTLKVILVGIVLATVLGLLAGIARLSSNWLIAKLAQVYVEIFQDTPLLIQLFFWYFAVILKLPRVRQSIELPGSVFLSNRGLTIPWVEPTASAGTWELLALGSLLAAVALYVLLGRMDRGGPRRYRRGVWALGVAVLPPIAGVLALAPFTTTLPKIEGFNYTGGQALSPEYVALLFGLVMYTGAFIAEIVRAGILAVPRGLTEAARALGLTYAQTLRLVTIPIALRVILPPLTNQYLNLAKNSSLAVAIGFADLFYVGNTIFNNSGQTVQIVVLIMATYLLISLTIAFLMNQLNARVRLKER